MSHKRLVQKAQKGFTPASVEAIDDWRNHVLTRLKTTYGVSADHVATWLPQLLHGALGPNTTNELVRGAVEEFSPRNFLEAMIASQLIALHSSAMNQLALSRHPDQTSEGVSQSLSRATKLLRASNELTQTWLALRGKRTSRQNVTVHHVHVGEGAQAIVGAVTGKTGGEGE